MVGGNRLGYGLVVTRICKHKKMQVGVRGWGVGVG